MWKQIFLGLGVGAVMLASAAVQAAKIDINQADEASLAEGITGVGPGIAASIVEYREQNGPFESVEELLEVRGIGEKILDRNRDNLTVEGSSN